MCELPFLASYPWAHLAWGADRIGYQLERDGIGPVPGRTSIYRALVRDGLGAGATAPPAVGSSAVGTGRPMELWQMDVVGGFHLANGTELKAVSGKDDSSRVASRALVMRRSRVLVRGSSVLRAEPSRQVSDSETPCIS